MASSSSADLFAPVTVVSNGYGSALLDRLSSAVVGRRRELESIVAALAAGRHLLLEGPPGTGKSTVLRSIAAASGSGFEFVEGNAELTPARLVGSFDPAAVLTDGYSPDAFIDGPLLSALREGSLLYLEELNRVPEETLNVLITVMSEGELHVPRLGRVGAVARVPAGGGDEPVRRRGHRSHRVGGLRPVLSPGDGLPGCRRGAGDRGPPRSRCRCRARTDRAARRGRGRA